MAVVGDRQAAQLWHIRTDRLMEQAGQVEEAPRRRSARVVLRISILVRVANGPVEMEWEAVQTVLVSLHGAMIRTRQQFPAGEALDIRMRYQERSARGRVVWRSREPTEQGFELGFEILDQSGFWGFNFPPDRWSEETRPRSAEN